MKRLSKIIRNTLSGAGLTALLLISSAANAQQTYIEPVQQITLEQDISKSVMDLGIYYGYPSYVEGSKGNIEQAVKTFSHLEYLIFGANLELESHTDHTNTAKIIEALNLLQTETYGYVDLGNTSDTSGFSMDEIYHRIDKWKEMNVKGIFFDSAYPGYNVDQKRLVDAVQYVDRNKLKLIVNSPDFFWALNTGVIKKQNEGHSFLIEPFLISYGQFLDPVLIDRTYQIVKHLTKEGYGFHGVGLYNDLTPQRDIEFLNSEIKKKAKELNLISVVLANAHYSGSGREANMLYLLDSK